MHFKLLFIFCFAGLNSFAQKKHFKIIGVLPEDIKTEIRLIINNDTLLTQTSNKGFIFEGSLENVVQAALSSNKGLCGSKFYVEPGIITLKVSVRKSGNDFCILIAEAIGSNSEDTYNAFKVERDKISKSTENIAVKKNKIQALIDRTIKANPDFIFSAQLLERYAKEFAVDWVEAQYQILSERVKVTKEGQSVKSLIEQTHAVKPGKMLPEMSLPDVNGRLFSLQSFKGKVVLIDFWASWCAPCRKEMPGLKKIYEKYKSQGFEIVAVSLDKDYDKWIKAIASDNLTWINLSDLQSWDSEISKYFHLEAIPFNILLDRDGRMVASELKGDKIEQAIKKILKH